MNQQEQIDRYLNHQMNSDELARFQAEMSANADLSEAVDLQRDLGTFFADRAPALEAILLEEGKRHFKVAPPKKNRSQWRWLLLLLPLFLGLGIWWWQNTSDNTEISIQEGLPSTQDDTPFIMDTTQVPPTIPIKEVAPTPLQKPSTNTQQNESTPPRKTPPLIARLNPADFQLNPILESIMAEQVRASAILTNMESPTSDTVFQANPNIFLKVKGTTTAAPPYELIIYPNRVFDFENDYRALSHSLSGVQQPENFTFSFSANVPFPSGLYYLLLQSETGDILHISRFKVE